MVLAAFVAFALLFLCVRACTCIESALSPAHVLVHSCSLACGVGWSLLLSYVSASLSLLLSSYVCVFFAVQVWLCGSTCFLPSIVLVSLCRNVIVLLLSSLCVCYRNVPCFLGLVCATLRRTLSYRGSSPLLLSYFFCLCVSWVLSYVLYGSSSCASSFSTCVVLVYVVPLPCDPPLIRLVYLLSCDRVLL